MIHTRKRLLAAIMTAALTLTGAVTMTADSAPVDVIVTLDLPDGVSPDTFADACAAYVTERFDCRSDYTYDTLLCGFHLSLPESMIGAIEALEYVESVKYCGTYATMDTDTSAIPIDVSMSARELIGLTDDVTAIGDGVKVAVLDNGFDVDHPAFRSDTITETLDILALNDAKTSKRLSVMRYVTDATEFYFNSKIPFRFDYADGDTDVSTYESHGTHVAGIIGALPTASDPMQGIAPGCQLLLMKVFPDNAGAAGTQTIIAALEDALRLGADVVNLSLGIYAGSVDNSQMIGIDGILDKMRNAGCLVVCAAGNDSVSTERSEYAGTATLPPAGYTDYGTLSAPAASDSVLAAASVDNRFILNEYFLHDDDAIAFSDTNAALGILDESFAEHFDGKTLEYAVIGGIGEDSDYDGIDVSGKIALIERGTTTFVEKVNIAAAHGAIAAIIRNHEDSEFSLELTGAVIPAISVSRADGEALASAKNRVVSFDADYIRAEGSDTAGQPSYYSSFGATPSLTLKPDMAGVGSTIWSTIPDDDYGSLSGTSMAAPQLSGAAALLIEQLKSDSSVPPTSYEHIVRTALMNTAVPLLQDNGAEYSPRVQGAGLLRVNAALNSELRVTYTVNDQPKAELSDLIGDFAYLDLELSNLTDEPLTVTIGATLTSDGYAQLEIDGKMEYFNTLEAVSDNVSSISAFGIAGNLNRNAEDYEPLVITINAGESFLVPLMIKFDENYHNALSKIFTNGHYAEGFIYCETASGSYSLPYMGYMGDWSDAPILDASYYGDDLTLFGGTMFATQVYDRIVILEVPDEAADIAFSPNGDGIADVLAFGAVYLRNARDGKMTVRDASGEVIFTQSTGYLTKSMGYGTSILFELGWQGGDGILAHYRFPDGLYTITFTYTLDFRTGLTQSYDYIVRIDTEKPTLTDISFADGKLTVCADDVSEIKAISICENLSDGALRMSVTDSDTAVFDLSDYEGETLYYEIIDHALNTLVGKVTLTEFSK